MRIRSTKKAQMERKDAGRGEVNATRWKVREPGMQERRWRKTQIDGPKGDGDSE